MSIRIKKFIIRTFIIFTNLVVIGYLTNLIFNFGVMFGTYLRCVFN